MKEITDLDFDLGYDLNEFRAKQDQYFDKNDKAWKGMHPGNHASIMEEMLGLINRLEEKILDLDSEVTELEIMYKESCDATYSWKEAARDAERNARDYNSEYSA